VSNFSTSQKVIPANEVVARIEEIEGIDSEDDNMTPYVTELTHFFLEEQKNHLTRKLLQPISIKGVEHHIRLKTDQPIVAPRRRHSQVTNSKMENQVGDMKGGQVIRDSTSSYRSEPLPMPNIEDILDALGGNSIFTTLDLASGYWQVPIAEEDRHFTATFQRAMDVILSGLNWKNCLCYLDDIIIFSKSWKQHLEDLEKVLDTKSPRMELQLIVLLSVSRHITGSLSKTLRRWHNPFTHWLLLKSNGSGTKAINWHSMH